MKAMQSPVAPGKVVQGQKDSITIKASSSSPNKKDDEKENYNNPETRNIMAKKASSRPHSPRFPEPRGMAQLVEETVAREPRVVARCMSQEDEEEARKKAVKAEAVEKAVAKGLQIKTRRTSSCEEHPRASKVGGTRTRTTEAGRVEVDEVSKRGQQENRSPNLQRGDGSDITNIKNLKDRPKARATGASPLAIPRAVHAMLKSMSPVSLSPRGLGGRLRRSPSHQQEQEPQVDQTHQEDQGPGPLQANATQCLQAHHSTSMTRARARHSVPQMRSAARSSGGYNDVKERGDYEEKTPPTNTNPGDEPLPAPRATPGEARATTYHHSASGTALERIVEEPPFLGEQRSIPLDDNHQNHQPSSSFSADRPRSTPGATAPPADQLSSAPGGVVASSSYSTTSAEEGPHLLAEFDQLQQLAKEGLRKKGLGNLVRPQVTSMKDKLVNDLKQSPSIHQALSRPRLVVTLSQPCYVRGLRHQNFSQGTTSASRSSQFLQASAATAGGGDAGEQPMSPASTSTLAPPEAQLDAQHFPYQNQFRVGITPRQLSPPPLHRQILATTGTSALLLSPLTQTRSVDTSSINSCMNMKTGGAYSHNNSTKNGCPISHQFGECDEEPRHLVQLQQVEPPYWSHSNAELHNANHEVSESVRLLTSAASSQVKAGAAIPIYDDSWRRAGYSLKQESRGVIDEQPPAPPRPKTGPGRPPVLPTGNGSPEGASFKPSSRSHRDEVLMHANNNKDASPPRPRRPSSEYNEAPSSRAASSGSSQRHQRPRPSLTSSRNTGASGLYAGARSSTCGRTSSTSIKRGPSTCPSPTVVNNRTASTATKRGPSSTGTRGSSACVSPRMSENPLSAVQRLKSEFAKAEQIRRTFERSRAGGLTTGASGSFNASSHHLRKASRLDDRLEDNGKNSSHTPVGLSVARSSDVGLAADKSAPLFSRNSGLRNGSAKRRRRGDGQSVTRSTKSSEMKERLATCARSRPPPPELERSGSCAKSGSFA
ncbi:unnamed protein product [Amoebophrya sp. A25]|nr:unnamed protein product [Amoebophrya sp. A25]|eukprot:GSA25T00024631001.1